MSFASLKKAASGGSTLSKLTQEIEKLNQPQTTGADERLWKPELDKSGNGYAVIRFLPAPDGEDNITIIPSLFVGIEKLIN